MNTVAISKSCFCKTLWNSALCILLTGSVSSIKVLNVELNANQSAVTGALQSSDGAGAILKQPDFPSASDYTVCLRFQFAKLQKSNILLRASTNSTRPLLQIDINIDKIKVIADFQSRYVFLRKWLQSRQWYSLCLLYQHTDLRLTTTLDSQVIGSHKLSEIKPARATGITFGFTEPSVFPRRSFIGNVTQLNLWNRILTEEELGDIAACQSTLGGNYIRWEGEWSFQNVKEYDQELEDLCAKELPTKFHVFPAMDHAESTYLCEALGGTLMTPKHKMEVTHMYLTAQAQRQDCDLIWVGVTDEKEEGAWHQRGRDFRTLPWAFDEPNGLHYENCAGIDPEGVIDDDCEMKRCPICNMADHVPMTLRGSCEENKYDTKFTMILKGEEILFEGYGTYVIKKSSDTWIWVDSEKKKIIADMLPSRYNYPLGRQRWHLRRPMCDQEAGQIRQLLLTKCQDDQFTCTDGTCVALDQRCDKNYDCYDNSDEEDCGIIRTSKEYKRHISPRLKRSTRQANRNEELQILAKMEIKALSVDTKDMVCDVTFNLSLTWRDPRVTFTNLKPQDSLNAVDINATNLWMPEIEFVNAIGDIVQLDKQKFTTRVLRQGRPTDTDNSVAEEVDLYLGSENPLVNTQNYRGTFACDFDFARYPFDKQTCYMILKVNDGVRWDVEGSLVEYFGGSPQLEYELGTISILPQSSTGDDTVLLVHIPVTRRIAHVLLRIYLPSVVMLFITLLTLFFVMNNFEVRCTTALSAIRLQINFYTETLLMLPETPYFKLIDYWLLFCIFLTALIIFLHMIIDLTQDYEKRRRTNSSDNLMVGRLSVRPSPRAKVTRFSRDLSLSAAIGKKQFHAWEAEDIETPPPQRKWCQCCRGGGWCQGLFCCRGSQRVTARAMVVFSRVIVAVLFIAFNIYYWLLAFEIV